MEYLPLSILAGVLTMLAPCVLPLLPVILSGASQGGSWRRPLVIIAAVCSSIFLFTLLIKTGAQSAGISEKFLRVVSGVVLVLYGLITVFPQIWETIEIKLNLNARAASLLNKAGNAGKVVAKAGDDASKAENSAKSGLLSEILIGLSLGPVFSSCSPTYAIIVAAILPVDFTTGLINLLAYTISFGLALSAVAILGNRLIKAARWATDPYSILRRALGLLFIFIGLLIITGLDKQIVAWVLETGYLDITRIENSLLGDKEIVL